jgi:hypothetical protein
MLHGLLFLERQYHSDMVFPSKYLDILFISSVLKCSDDIP